jgi:predicted dienelactone hydrolase
MTSSSKRLLLPLLVAAVGFVAEVSQVAVAAAPGTVVGSTTLAFSDSTRGRNLPSEIWFEAQAGTPSGSFSPLLPIAAIELSKDALPATGAGKRPLVVISHGNWGTRFSQGWMARQLVLAGYVVISPSHPGTMNDDRNMAGAIRLWDRSQDVRRVLDQVLADPQWAPLIDSNRIGFLGHSFGGWTGVSLAGGRYDHAAQLAACQAQSPKDMYCTGMTTEDLSAISLAGSEGDYRDARIKAMYLVATGPGRGMTTASLKQISVPIVLDTARLDDVLASPDNSTWLAANIPGATEVVREVGHFSYVPLCRPLIGKLAASLICSDPAGVDRASVHQAVAANAVAFFDQQLSVNRATAP